MAVACSLPVQHKGEFVLTKTGLLDFGEISNDVARIIKRQAGKIRLRIGQQTGTAGDYGERHIERPERIQALNKCGYSSARDFIEDVCTNYDAIYQGQSGTLILARHYTKKNHVAIVKLVPSADGDFYDVQTGYPSRNSGRNKNPLLWKRTGEANNSGHNR